MPIFDFHCNKCNNEFEKLVRKDEDKVCPNCASTDLDKMVSKSNFALKGVGVYKNNTH